MKKIFIISISIILLISLSFGIGIFIGIYINKNPYKTYIDYEYNENLSKDLENKEREIDNLVSTNTDINRIKILLNEVEDIISTINTYKDIESINLDIESLQGNIKQYNKFYDIIYDYKKWLSNIRLKIYESSLKDEFYEGLNDKEIIYLIYSNSIDALNKLEEINNIKQEYENLNNEDNFSYYYANYVKLTNEYANILGYDNYFDLMNEKTYYRDYSLSDIDTLIDYASKYILHTGLYNEINRKYYFARNYSSFIQDGVINIRNNSYKNYTNEIGNYLNTLSDNIYSFYNNYDKILLGKDKNSKSGAYTIYLNALNTPAMYLGYNYQSVFTFIHEFGHSYSYLSQKKNKVSYDLCELQSQGNELLFLYYLENLDYLNNYEKTFLKYYILSNVLDEYILTLGVGDFEKYIYSDNNITEDDVDYYLSKASNDLTGSNNNNILISYIKSVVFSTPIYYISYATSKLNAIELYINANQDFDLAKNQYLYLLEYDNYDGYLNTINNINLSSPFDDNLYIKIKNYFI